MDIRCRVTELCDKEVINLCDGRRLGYVSDVEVDTCDGCLCAIIVPGSDKCSLFSSSKQDSIVIPWEKIDKIGDDIIIVNVPLPPCPPEQRCDTRKRRFF